MKIPSTIPPRDTEPQTPASKTAALIGRFLDASHPSDDMTRMQRLVQEMEAAFLGEPEPFLRGAGKSENER